MGATILLSSLILGFYFIFVPPLFATTNRYDLIDKK